MLDIFDILGPVMVGPSSSHTAGAVRIGHMARTLLGTQPVKAEIGLYGSFEETGQGHGTHRALVAGLLHDCAKHYSDSELQEKCKQFHLQVSENEMRLPWLLHAAYGAYLAKTEYQIQDMNILNAIRNHTVGRPGMSKLEQIVFLADYFEPERTQKTVPPLDEIRKIAFHDLDEAVYLVLENTIRYLESSGQDMATETKETYLYYKNRRVK